MGEDKLAASTKTQILKTFSDYDSMMTDFRPTSVREKSKMFILSEASIFELKYDTASDPNLMSAGTEGCPYNNSEVINEMKDTIRYTEINETPSTFMENTDHFKLELETASEMMTEIDTVSNFKSTLQDSSSDPSLNPDPDPQKEYDTMENTDHFQLEHDTASGMMTEIDTVSNFKSTLQEMNTDTGDPMTLEQDENLYNGKIHQGKTKSIRYTETNETPSTFIVLMSAGIEDCSYNNSEVINEMKDTISDVEGVRPSVTTYSIGYRHQTLY